MFLMEITRVTFSMRALSSSLVMMPSPSESKSLKAWERKKVTIKHPTKNSFYLVEMWTCESVGQFWWYGNKKYYDCRYFPTSASSCSDAMTLFVESGWKVPSYDLNNSWASTGVLDTDPKLFYLKTYISPILPYITICCHLLSCVANIITIWYQILPMLP